MEDEEEEEVEGYVENEAAQKDKGEEKELKKEELALKLNEEQLKKNCLSPSRK